MVDGGRCVVDVELRWVVVVVDEVVVLVAVGLQPAFRTRTLQLAWSVPAETARLLTWAAQLT